MNSETGVRLMWALAGLAVVCAVFLTVRSIGSTRESLARIERKADDLSSLRNMQVGTEDARAAVATYEALGSKMSTPLRDVLAKSKVDAKADIRERDSRNVSSGWTLRRMDVIFEALSLEDLGRFLTAGESIRPPWQLVECHITASENAGRGSRVTLLMETLEKR